MVQMYHKLPVNKGTGTESIKMIDQMGMADEFNKLSMMIDQMETKEHAKEVIGKDRFYGHAFLHSPGQCQ